MSDKEEAATAKKKSPPQPSSSNGGNNSASKKDKKNKSQSTTNLETSGGENKRDTTGKEKSSTSNNLDHHKSLNSLGDDRTKLNRTVSHSPPNRDRTNEDSQHSTNAEKKHKNGFMKRLSLRFKSHSIDHPEVTDSKKAKKSSPSKSKEEAAANTTATNKAAQKQEQPQKQQSLRSTMRASSQNNNIDRVGVRKDEYDNQKSTSSDQLNSSKDGLGGGGGGGGGGGNASYKIIRVRLDRESSNYSNEDAAMNIQAMKKVFDLFDRDHDGSITVEDVQEVMKSLSFLEEELEMPSIDQIRESFAKFDENKNGRIEFNEFLNIEKSAVASMPYDREISRSVYLYPPSSAMAAQPAVYDIDIDERPVAVRRNQAPMSLTPTPAINDDRLLSAATGGGGAYARSVSSHSNQSAHSNTNGSGEFLMNDEVVQANMKLIFDQFDKDMDGRITRAELNFVMSNLFPDEVITSEDIDNMLKAADLDKNGFIDFEEFSQMFNLYGKSLNDGSLDK